MFLSRESWRSRGPFLSPDGDGTNGGNNESSSDDAAASAAAKSGDGERGNDKEALKRMGEQRDAAREEAKKAADELAVLRKEKAEREAEEAKRREQEAAEAGKFEELAAKREHERDEAKAEAAALRAENDQFKAAMAEGLAVHVKALPDAVRKVLEATIDEDNVLGRWSWLHKSEVQALIAEHGEKPAKSGNPVNPRSSGQRENTDEAARKSQAILYRNF